MDSSAYQYQTGADVWRDNQGSHFVCLVLEETIKKKTISDSEQLQSLAVVNLIKYL